MSKHANCHPLLFFQKHKLFLNLTKPNSHWTCSLPHSFLSKYWVFLWPVKTRTLPRGFLQCEWIQRSSFIVLNSTGGDVTSVQHHIAMFLSIMMLRATESQKFEVQIVFKCFWKKSLQKAAFIWPKIQKYCEILLQFKITVSIWVYFLKCYLFSIIFSTNTLVFRVKWSPRNH